MPELPYEIQCPECTQRIWCSEEDPDAGMAEMWNHVKDHAAEQIAERGGSLADMRRLSAELLAKAVVPDA